MGKNSDILISIYKKAKAKRLVLNQDEFAKALDYSRVHLFDKKIKKNDISAELIKKANDFLNNTNNVSRETLLNNQDNISATILELAKAVARHAETISSQQYVIRRYIEMEADIGEVKNG